MLISLRFPSDNLPIVKFKFRIFLKQNLLGVEIFLMMIRFILWIDGRQGQEVSLTNLLNSKQARVVSIVFYLLALLKKCDKPSFEQLWASLVHYGSPTTILSTDKTALASLASPTTQRYFCHYLLLLSNWLYQKYHFSGNWKSPKILVCSLLFYFNTFLT